MQANPANGLYVGKIIYLTGSANIDPQTATVKSFTTTGTVGGATYYVTQIVIEEQNPNGSYQSPMERGYA